VIARRGGDGLSSYMSDTDRTPSVPLVPSTAVLTYAEAAELTGVSPDTIERDRKADRYPGAHRDESRRGAWVVPVTDLVTAGRLPASAVAEVESALVGLRESRRVRELTEELIRLRAELAAAQTLIARLDTDRDLHLELLRAALPAGIRKGA